MLTLFCMLFGLIASNNLCYKYCNEVGTKSCRFGTCICADGFTGFGCDRCANGFFGPECHPIDTCCESEIGEMIENLENGVVRVRTRRDIVNNSYMSREYAAMRELTNIQERLEKLWRDVTKAPFTDDLHMYIADITHKISQLIEMINELTPMFHSDIQNTYYAWNVTTAEEIGKLWTDIGAIESDYSNLENRADKLEETRNAIHNLTGVEDEARTIIQLINRIGIELERDYQIGLKNATQELQTDEIVELKNMLIQNMTKLHEEILVAFYEPGPDGPPLFDDAEGLAVNLTDTVLESSIRLPHGWPNASSWLDEAKFVKEQIHLSTQKSLDIISQVDDLINEIELETIVLRTNLSTVQGWKDEVIDERDLIIYIDLLYSMSKNYDSVEQEIQTAELIKQMAHVKELEKQFNELGLLYDEAALTDMTPEQTKEIKEQTKVLKEGQEKIENALAKSKKQIDGINKELGSVTETNKDMNKAANKVEVNASEFNSKLNELETLLNQPASEGFKELSKKSKVITDGNKKLGTIEDDVSRILTEMEKLTKEMAKGTRRRKKRSNDIKFRIMRTKKSRRSRHSKNRRNHKSKRQLEQPNMMEEVTSVLIEIDDLIKEIEDYRDASLEVNLKTYLESAIQFEAKDEDEPINDLLDEICGNGLKCESLQDYEDQIESDIKILTKRAENAMKSIRSCVSDPCWSSNLLFDADETTRPDLLNC